MATPTFTVKCLSIAYDGTNTYAEMSISDGTSTMQTIRPVFPTDVTAAQITSYMQTVATNRPVITSSFAALVGTSVTG